MQQLTILEGFYPDHHRAVGSSPKTIHHYRNTFLVFHRFLNEQALNTDSSTLLTATFNRFAAVLREPPTKDYCGGTERSVVTIHADLKDMRAFVRWLYEQDHIETVPKVPISRLPQTLFPVLTDAELQLIFYSHNLDTATEIGKRNRALPSFML